MRQVQDYKEAGPNTFFIDHLFYTSIVIIESVSGEKCKGYVLDEMDMTCRKQTWHWDRPYVPGSYFQTAFQQKDTPLARALELLKTCSTVDEFVLYYGLMEAL